MAPVPPQPVPRAREGTRGTTLSPARPARTPNAGSSAKPLPDLSPPCDARLTSRKGPAHTPGKRPHEPLDTKRHRSVVTLTLALGSERRALLVILAFIG